MTHQWTGGIDINVDSIADDHSESLTNKSDNNIDIAPVVRIISNFSELMKDNEAYYVYDPFLAFEGGYQMIMSICVSGCGEGNGTHISMYVHLMKGPHDDELQQLSYWPFRGVIEIALLNQLKDECHCYQYIALDENVLRNCTTRVTLDDKIGLGYGLDQGWLLSNLKNSVFLKDDSLHFRISYKRYFFYFALEHVLKEIPTFISISFYNFIFVSAALIFAEFVVFCSGETVLKPKLFSFGSVIVFLFTNIQVTIYSGSNVLCRAVKRFLTMMMIIALNMVIYAVVEVMYCDMSTRFEAIHFVARRIFQVLMWSCTVEVYEMSWRSSFPMIGPMWILYLFSWDLYTVLLAIYRIYSIVYSPIVCILLLYDVIVYVLYKNKASHFILLGLWMIFCIFLSILGDYSHTYTKNILTCIVQFLSHLLAIAIMLQSKH